MTEEFLTKQLLIQMAAQNNKLFSLSDSVAEMYIMLNPFITGFNRVLRIQK